MFIHHHHHHHDNDHKRQFLATRWWKKNSFIPLDNLFSAAATTIIWVNQNGKLVIWKFFKLKNCHPWYTHSESEYRIRFILPREMWFWNERQMDWLVLVNLFSFFSNNHLFFISPNCLLLCRWLLLLSGMVSARFLYDATILFLSWCNVYDTFEKSWNVVEWQNKTNVGVTCIRKWITNSVIKWQNSQMAKIMSPFRCWWFKHFGNVVFKHFAVCIANNELMTIIIKQNNNHNHNDHHHHHHDGCQDYFTL